MFLRKFTFSILRSRRSRVKGVRPTQKLMDKWSRTPRSAWNRKVQLRRYPSGKTWQKQARILQRTSGLVDQWQAQYRRRPHFWLSSTPQRHSLVQQQRRIRTPDGQVLESYRASRNQALIASPLMIPTNNLVFSSSWLSEAILNNVWNTFVKFVVWRFWKVCKK